MHMLAANAARRRELEAARRGMSAAAGSGTFASLAERRGSVATQPRHSTLEEWLAAPSDESWTVMLEVDLPQLPAAAGYQDLDDMTGTLSRHASTTLTHANPLESARAPAAPTRAWLNGLPAAATGWQLDNRHPGWGFGTEQQQQQ